jgi:hypothetical protein
MRDGGLLIWVRDITWDNMLTRRIDTWDIRR